MELGLQVRGQSAEAAQGLSWDAATYKKKKNATEPERQGLANDTLSRSSNTEKPLSKNTSKSGMQVKLQMQNNWKLQTHQLLLFVCAIVSVIVCLLARLIIY